VRIFIDPGLFADQDIAGERRFFGWRTGDRGRFYNFRVFGHFHVWPSGSQDARSLGASFLMLFFGIIDDLKELSVLQKFLSQSLCASMLIYSGVMTDIMYLGFLGKCRSYFFLDIGDYKRV
jgi:hypothetical protein